MFNHNKKEKRSEQKKKLKAIKKKEKEAKTKNKKKLTKAERKEMKRKRKAFQTSQKKYDIEGGIAGDRDPRTKRDMFFTGIAITAMILMIIGIVSYGFGQNAYSNFKKNNTEEFGSIKSFTQSKVKVKFSEVWTDKDREVTVVKFGYPDKTKEKLSNRGKAYKLYMKPKGAKPKAQMAYGILGIEGDGYLFIKGKLKDQPYHIGIENTLTLTTKTIDSSTSTSSALTDKSEDNLESAISSMNEDGSSNSWFKKDDEGTKAKNERDFIKFIINPYSDNTKVYKGSFLNGSGEIDYSKVIAQTSVDSAIKDKEKDYDKHKANLKDLKTSEKEYQKRVDQEKKESKKTDKEKDKEKDKDKDKSTTTERKSKNESNLEKTQQAIKDEEDQMNALKEEINTLKSSDFGKKDFGEMQNKSTIY
ncbi:TPA: hypothetical protein ACU3MR_002525 [Staphylococcus aureus]